MFERVPIEAADWEDRSSLDTDGPTRRWARRVALAGGGVIALVAVATMPALAQSEAASGFCETNLAQTLRNILNLIRLAGPLIGGVVAVGSVVVLPVVRRADFKRELKSIRNQAVIWGVIVAPIGTTFLQFLLTDIVAGASGCAF